MNLFSYTIKIQNYILKILTKIIGNICDSVSAKDIGRPNIMQ